MAQMKAETSVAWMVSRMAVTRVVRRVVGLACWRVDEKADLMVE
jgi:hypothetical protein